ncbi:MAG: hypothetical protein GC159_14010 [Phycisphaera sp.]|nr:hypothetical protein [Phycisphaera sp.]
MTPIVRRFTRRAASLAAAVAIAASLGACSEPRINNTRLGSTDLVVMTDRMVQSLMANNAVASRTPRSEPWVVTLDRVSNRTNDIIPDGEKWLFMARLRARLSESPSLRDRNLTFIVPAERRGQIEHEGHPAETLKPTHALAATFHALTTQSRGGRTDTYLCAFELLDLRDDHLVWEDSYEIKQAVVRNKLD